MKKLITSLLLLVATTSLFAQLSCPPTEWKPNPTVTVYNSTAIPSTPQVDIKWTPAPGATHAEVFLSPQQYISDSTVLDIFGHYVGCGGHEATAVTPGECWLSLANGIQSGQKHYFFITTEDDNVHMCISDIYSFTVGGSFATGTCSTFGCYDVCSQQVTMPQLVARLQTYSGTPNPPPVITNPKPGHGKGNSGKPMTKKPGAVQQSHRPAPIKK